MIIYNVTINIEEAVHLEWVKWMKETHIPDVLATGCFTEGKLFHILVDEEQGVSYSAQYRANSMEDVQRYVKEFAPKLREDMQVKFKDQFHAFRTLLEEA